MKFTDYRADFRAGWRALLATSLGLSSGMALHPFVMNVLAPHMIEGVGWSKADFALAAMVSGLTIFSYPVVGKLADRFGVRRIGAVGIGASALSYLAIAMLDGPIRYYMAVLVLQLTLGAMTTGPVFLRMIVTTFDRSRGVALAIAVSSPAVVAAVASPLLSRFIETSGWRSGSLGVAMYTLVVGTLALLLVPGGNFGGSVRSRQSDAPTSTLRALLARSDLRCMITITILVSVPLPLVNSQLSLVLTDNGVALATAGSIVGLFAAGTIVGRLVAGVALDRFNAEAVGAAAFCLPAIGMLLIASPLDNTVVLAAAITIMGLAFGAEGDVLAYIVSRYIGLESYGTVLGILFASVGVSAMLAAFALSRSLQYGGGYTPFLLGASLSVVLGSLLLFRLRGLQQEDLPDAAPEASIVTVGEY